MVMPQLPQTIAELQQQQFSIGATHFEISKLLPQEAYTLLERMRVALAPGLGSHDWSVSDTAMGVIQALILVVANIPPSQLESIRDEMFSQVHFTNETAKQSLPLAGNIGLAFENLEPVHIYEVLLRCLAVNFTGSLRAILSLMPAIQQNTSRPVTGT